VKTPYTNKTKNKFSRLSSHHQLIFMRIVKGTVVISKSKSLSKYFFPNQFKKERNQVIYEAY